MCLGKTGLKAFLLAINVIFFLCGGAVMGIGIWAVADKLYISDIVGSSLFNSASYMMVIAGVFLIFVSFLGCVATIGAKKIVVIIYLGIQIFIFIFLMAAAIVAAVFQDEIEGNLKQRMERTVRENYGFYIDSNEENRQATESWDLLQTRLQCCAVDDSGWYLYQTSRWFLQQYTEYDKKFVPLSCCKYVGQLRQYLDPGQCQRYQFGPPTHIGWGVSHNEALNYAGCYNAAKEFVESQSTLILGVGFSFCVFLITGIIITIMFLRKISGSGSGSADLRY